MKLGEDKSGAVTVSFSMNLPRSMSTGLFAKMTVGTGSDGLFQLV